jgi:hypothetical protein
MLNVPNGEVYVCEATFPVSEEPSPQYHSTESAAVVMFVAVTLVPLILVPPEAEIEGHGNVVNVISSQILVSVEVQVSFTQTVYEVLG